ncbi:MAG: PAM68 family protein [Oscillatoria princeps RMCB-10]|jgi:hypothetical protein|nr:PAM68 family protein [Oscillatoria princeps RMCB-10]
MSPEPERERLPFEPASHRKKSPKNRPEAPPAAVGGEKEGRLAKEDMAIPDAVSKRMIGRMALLCGVPTALGIGTFIASYITVSNEWFKLPNVAVVLVSMGFFGLGVLGLSYGVLSASWDEEIPGSKLGWKEFTTNLGRMREAWQSRKPS